MTTSGFLLEHGTKAFSLPPSAIVCAAENDLRMREQKQHDEIEVAAQYAFVARHVRKAENAADLLKRAIDGRDRGLVSRKVNTRLLYGDEELLRRALALAQSLSPQPVRAVA